MSRYDEFMDEYQARKPNPLEPILSRRALQMYMEYLMYVVHTEGVEYVSYGDFFGGSFPREGEVF